MGASEVSHLGQLWLCHSQLPNLQLGNGNTNKSYSLFGSKVKAILRLVMDIQGFIILSSQLLYIYNFIHNKRAIKVKTLEDNLHYFPIVRL